MSSPDDKLSQYLDNKDTAWGDVLEFLRQDDPRKTWTSVAAAGLAAYNLMLKAGAEKDSPIDDLLSAIAAEADELAVLRVSALLGLKPQDVQDALDKWDCWSGERREVFVRQFRASVKTTLSE